VTPASTAATIADVFVAVDDPGHRGHALGVDHAQPLRVCAPRRHRRDLAAAHDNRARLDHLSVADDDARVGDRDVLGRDITRSDEAGDQRESGQGMPRE
jgi:hypothetical protein